MRLPPPPSVSKPLKARLRVLLQPKAVKQRNEKNGKRASRAPRGHGSLRTGAGGAGDALLLQVARWTTLAHVRALADMRQAHSQFAGPLQKVVRQMCST